MNSYEAKQEARRERLEARADRLRNEGKSRIARAHEMAEAIPFGQPILVGHHSEKRDRNYRSRIHSGFARGFETLRAADEVAGRTASVGLGGISSDDPDAVAKLQAELAELESRQAMMVEANKLVRKSDTVGLASLVGEKCAASLVVPDSCGRLGFADYQLSNNSANMRRIRARIEQLKRMSKRETKTIERPDGIRIVENAEANRLQLFFPGKPPAAARTALKSNGFRWSPTEGAWQRQLNNSARYVAEWVLGEIAKGA